jgi:hypothetical protein
MVDQKSYDQGWNDAMDRAIEVLRNQSECVITDEEFGYLKKRFEQEFRK